MIPKVSLWRTYFGIGFFAVFSLFIFACSGSYGSFIIQNGYYDVSHGLGIKFIQTLVLFIISSCFAVISILLTSIFASFDIIFTDLLLYLIVFPVYVFFWLKFISFIYDVVNCYISKTIEHDKKGEKGMVFNLF